MEDRHWRQLIAELEQLPYDAVYDRAWSLSTELALTAGMLKPDDAALIQERVRPSRGTPRANPSDNNKVDPPTGKIDSVPVYRPVLGKVALGASDRLSAMRGPDAADGSWQSVLAVAPLDRIRNLLSVPVRTLGRDQTLRYQLAEGWDRLPLGGASYLSNSIPLTPLLLSSRDKWVFNEGAIDVYDRAILLDGAHRIYAALVAGAPSRIPLMIIQGLTVSEEMRIRKAIATKIEVDALEQRSQVGTDTPRLDMADREHVVTIESEPFVIPTARGYAPAILVRRLRAKQREHVFIGAKSLSAPLEEFRTRFGSLSGCTVAVRKNGKDQTSQYSVRLIERGAQ